MMKDKIESIDWAKLENAYTESSEQLGILLTAAYTTKNEKAFEELLDWVWNSLIHQGTIYPITAEALPFLIELVKFSSSDARARLLRFIAEVSYSVSEYVRFMEVLDERPFSEIPDGPEFLRKCNTVLADNVGVFERLIIHEDEQVRVTIPFLLNTIINRPAPLNKATSIESNPGKIQSLIVKEQSAFVKCSLIFLLRSVAVKDKEGVTVLKELLQSENDQLVRIILALALTEHGEFKLSLVPLTAALDRIEETDKLYNNQLMWFNGRLRFQVVDALCKFPHQFTDQLMNAFLKVVQVANKHSVEVEIAPILKFVFKGRKISDENRPVKLSYIERKILQAIYDRGLVGTDSGNASLGYKSSIGIPDNKLTWQQILADNPITLGDRVLALIRKLS